MSIRIKVDREWQDRIVGISNSVSVGRFVVVGDKQYKRSDFATPKFIRIKIKRI